jgi:hypothetical protein
MELTKAEQYFDDLVRTRRAAGRKTYGKGLTHTDTEYNWDRMALEEALDMGQYLMAQNLRLHDEIARLKKALRAQTLVAEANMSSAASKK